MNFSTNNVINTYFRIVYLKSLDDSLLKTSSNEEKFQRDRNRSFNHILDDSKEKVSNEFKRNFYLSVSLIGAIRGAISLIIEHPLESIKTQWQDKNTITSARKIVNEIYKTKGLTGFYRGFSPNCARVVFKNCYRWPMMLYFPSLFDKILPENLISNFSSLPKILTGIAIANIEVFIICPLDRLKIFFMTSASKGVNMFKYFYINHKENMMRELFRGLGVSFWRSNVSWVSFLYLDDKFKRIFKKAKKIDTLGIYDLLIISIFVGVGNLASSKFKTYSYKFKKFK